MYFQPKNLKSERNNTSGPKLLNNSGPETSPEIFLLLVSLSLSASPSHLFYEAAISSTRDKSSPETCPAPRHFLRQDIFVSDFYAMNFKEFF
jgi:hypothetical protein